MCRRYNFPVSHSTNNYANTKIRSSKLSSQKPSTYVARFRKSKTWASHSYSTNPLAKKSATPGSKRKQETHGETRKIMSANENDLDTEGGLAGKGIRAWRMLITEYLMAGKKKDLRWLGYNSSHTSFCTFGCWTSAWGATKFRKLVFLWDLRLFGSAGLVVVVVCIHNCKASISLFVRGYWK